MKKSFQEIAYLTPRDHASAFTELYIAVRKKENRVLSDEEVLELPNVSKRVFNYKEWRVRKKSAHRFLNYLSQQKKIRSVLDLGCGNGWFSNWIAKSFSSITVTGLDINEIELEQANRVFQSTNLKFAYADIFKLEPSAENKFDLIVLNASVQYFSDFTALILVLRTFLEPNGEIHLIDSPFYNDHQIYKARENTKSYFKKLGFPEMSKYYFHHNVKKLHAFNILYRPEKRPVDLLLGRTDSPFMWLRLKDST
ncbi:class I SAM-dependent methyltransferase [Aestuariivivens sediminis]|uniref:class I SAM-dependent methyltransferase n=1 Tax=Aestuariivivens sediminis TaxID=2913557 RepID=UPI001F589B5E|nr:class I SAM-dependent methyltransferase [Aestuariivivens sediminis]